MFLRYEDTSNDVVYVNLVDKKRVIQTGGRVAVEDDTFNVKPYHIQALPNTMSFTNLNNLRTISGGCTITRDPGQCTDIIDTFTSPVHMIENVQHNTQTLTVKFRAKYSKAAGSPIPIASITAKIYHVDVNDVDTLIATLVQSGITTSYANYMKTATVDQTWGCGEKLKVVWSCKFITVF